MYLARLRALERKGLGLIAASQNNDRLWNTTPRFEIGEGPEPPARDGPLL
jgi:hypothetical protein